MCKKIKKFLLKYETRIHENGINLQLKALTSQYVLIHKINKFSRNFSKIFMGKDEFLLIHLLIQKSELIHSLASIHKAKNFVIMQKIFYDSSRNFTFTHTQKNLYNSAHTQKIISAPDRLKAHYYSHTKNFYIIQLTHKKIILALDRVKTHYYARTKNFYIIRLIT